MTCPGTVILLAPVKNVSTKHVNKPWTSLELRDLREHAHLGAAAVALLLGRSRSCVERMASRQRISLRVRGEHRGSVLGQPRGHAILPQIRGDVVSGKVSAEAIAERMTLLRVAALCPVCGSRPIEVATTGYCVCCHKRLLAEAHLGELEKLDAQKALWASRQALCRARKAAET